MDAIVSNNLETILVNLTNRKHNVDWRGNSMRKASNGGCKKFNASTFVSSQYDSILVNDINFRNSTGVHFNSCNDVHFGISERVDSHNQVDVDCTT